MNFWSIRSHLAGSYNISESVQLILSRDNSAIAFILINNPGVLYRIKSLLIPSIIISNVPHIRKL